MHRVVETSVHSAKSLMELSEKEAHGAKIKEAASKQTLQLSSEQIALLKESNELASKVYTEAQQVRADSVKASKKATWSNIIAVASLLVAVASLTFTFYSSNT